MADVIFSFYLTVVLEQYTERYNHVILIYSLHRQMKVELWTINNSRLINERGKNQDA